jgi:hypothetical protein
MKRSAACAVLTTKIEKSMTAIRIIGRLLRAIRLLYPERRCMSAIGVNNCLAGIEPARQLHPS